MAKDNFNQATLFDIEEYTIEHPLKDRRVSLIGKFENRAALLRKIKSVGADSKSNDNLVKSTQILVMGNDVKQEDLSKKTLYEHDGFHPLVITLADLQNIFDGHYAGYETPRELEKKISIDMSYYNWTPPVVADDEEDASATTRCTSPLVYGDGNPISGLEIYVPDIPGRDTGIVRQLIGNLGGYANAEYFDDTDVVLLGDETLQKLEKGEKDDVIRHIENIYNNSSSNTFNIQFTSESDLIGWVKSRIEKTGDQSTKRLVDAYLSIKK